MRLLRTDTEPSSLVAYVYECFGIPNSRICIAKQMFILGGGMLIVIYLPHNKTVTRHA